MAVCFTTTYVSTQFVHGNYIATTLYAEFDYIIPFLLLIVILCRTPKFEDNFYIRKEIKWVFLCLIIMYSSYYSGRVLETLFIHHPHQQSIVKFIANQILMAAQFS